MHITYNVYVQYAHTMHIHICALPYNIYRSSYLRSALAPFLITRSGMHLKQQRTNYTVILDRSAILILIGDVQKLKVQSFHVIEVLRSGIEKRSRLRNNTNNNSNQSTNKTYKET